MSRHQPNTPDPSDPTIPARESERPGEPLILPPGTLLLERYRIVSFLGRGGMGEVYRADDLTLGQSVALKFLPDAVATDESRLARLREEVRQARLVSHRNVCRVHDIATDPGDGVRPPRVFVAMEYVDGEDLASLLRRIGRLPFDKGIDVARQLCSALSAVHAEGIIHRDLKPENVMLDGRGRVRLMDFGIAAAIGAARDVRSGTPAYMAPEQQAGKEATERSDIYALGLVIHEVLTGRLPGDTPTPRPGTRGSSTRSGSDPEPLDPATDRIIKRCLAADPAARPKSALAVALALPGGDPLAAAIAAGETPSPELIAAAGEAGGTHPGIALLLVAIAAIATAASLYLNRWTEVINFVSLPKPTAVLKDQARSALASLGYIDAPVDSFAGWYSNEPAFKVLRESHSLRELLDIGDSKRSRTIVFWYRESPQRLAPLNNFAIVTLSDPPMLTPRMASYLTDANGRLLSFRVVPPRASAESSLPEPDWERAFTLAGLNFADFQPITPTLNTRSYVDDHRAWTGVFPDDAETSITIHAGAYAGRVTEFSVLTDAEFQAARAESASAGRDDSPLRWLRTILVFVTVIGGGVLTWRNLRSRRSDSAGATRIALVLSLIAAIGLVLQANRIPSYTMLVFGSAPHVAAALLGGAVFWVFYVALEPYARKVWPSTLIAWARLLSGRVTDPMVGRDVLIALCAGGLLAVLTDLSPLTPILTGEKTTIIPRFTSNDAFLIGPRAVAAGLSVNLLNAVISGSAQILILVLMRLLLRRATLAAIAFSLLIFALFHASVGGGYGAIAGAVAMTAILVFVMLRFGLLALILSIFFSSVVASTPVTLAMDTWFAAPALIPLGILAVAAAHGFFTATRGRKLFPDLEV